MECTKCHISKSLNEYTLKNKKDGIYYLYCDQCREKTLNIQEKYKKEAKENYELKKITDYINCECGKSFVSFRDFHMKRHLNSKFHLMFLEKKNNQSLNENKQN